MFWGGGKDCQRTLVIRIAAITLARDSAVTIGAVLKRTNVRGQTPICDFLRKSGFPKRFLSRKRRASAKLQRKSGKVCVRARFCTVRFVPLSAPRTIARDFAHPQNPSRLFFRNNLARLKRSSEMNNNLHKVIFSLVCLRVFFEHFQK